MFLAGLLTQVRSPTAPPEHLGYPGYLGYLGYPGRRRCASTRPPGRALALLTAVNGWGRHWGRHWARRWARQWARRRGPRSRRGR